MNSVILINIGTSFIDKTATNEKNKSQYPPFALLGLEAFLRMHGYRVKVIDLFYISFSVEELIENINSFDHSPLAIGVSSYSEGVSVAYSVIVCLRKMFPRSKIIMGGHHVSFIPETFFEIGGDFIVRFEGESTLIVLLEYIKYPKHLSIHNVLGIIFIKNGSIIHTESRGFIRSLDFLPFTENPLYTSPASDRLHVITSRGCPGECTFCASSAFSGRRVRTYSAEWVYSYIYYFKMHYMKKTVIDFIDDTFTSDNARLKRILCLLNNSGFVFSWHARCRLSELNKPLIKYFADNRCLSLHFGVESGDQKILRTLKKNVNLIKLQSLMGPMVQAGIKPRCSFMIGHPQDTLRTISKTLYLASCIVKYDLALVGLSISTPFPGTVLYNDSDKLGLRILTKNWDNYTTTKPVYSTERFDSNDLRQAFYYFHNDRNKVLHGACFNKVNINRYRKKTKTWIARIVHSS
jgi:radical SAM superfamily enzyme YgiQ (UPF0313 family)